MAHIHPFRAIRPVQEQAEIITALPYDVYNKNEARIAVRRAPDSFLAIDRPEAHFPENTDIDTLWVRAQLRYLRGKENQDSAGS